MSTLSRLVLVSILTVSLGIPSGCAKKEEVKPKVTKKKAKKLKAVTPVDAELVAEKRRFVFPRWLQSRGKK